MPFPLIPIAIGAVAAVIAWNNRREIQAAIKDWSESDSGKRTLEWLKSFGNSMAEGLAEMGRAREAVELLLSKGEEERHLLLEAMAHEATLEKVQALRNAAEKNFGDHPRANDLLGELAPIIKTKRRQQYVKMLEDEIEKIKGSSN